MIELRHLRYLTALAEEQSFSRAAKRLQIAQPGLSHHIGELERQLGARLVDRATRPVRLTPAGQALVDEGRRVLVAFDEALEFSRRVASGAVGRIRIGAVASATFEVLPRLLRAYRARYPEVQLVLREMTTPGQIDAIASGEIDLGIIRLPYETGDLPTHHIREEGLGLVLPEEHPLTRLAEIPLRALEDQPLVLFPAGPHPTWARSFIPRVCREAGFEPRIVQEAVDSATAISFVAAEIGMALIPESMRQIVRAGVVYRPVAPPVPTLALVAIHRPNGSSATVAAMLRLLGELWPPATVTSSPAGRRPAR